MDTPIAVIAVVVVVGIFAILGQFASALAKRLERRPSDTASPDPAPDPAVAELRQQLEAVQERLDFIERVLVARKEQSDRVLLERSDRPEPEDPNPS